MELLRNGGTFEVGTITDLDSPLPPQRKDQSL